MKIRYLMLLAAAVGTGCAAGHSGLIENRPYEHQPIPDNVPERTVSCVNRPGVEHFLESSHKRAIENWNISYGTESHRVEVIATVADSGAWSVQRVAMATNEKFVAAVVEAIDSMDPVPIPDAASCIVNVQLRFAFETAIE